MYKEMHILFVDDQWCTSKGRDVLIAAFGHLLGQDPPCVFYFETAETAPGQYAPEPVLKTLFANPQINAIVLDIMFGSTANRMGLDILSAVRAKYPILPVFMMTSLDRDNLDVLVKAMSLGASEYIVKKPSAKEFEHVLRIYTNPSATEAEYVIWGNSTAVRQMRATITRVSIGGTASVLVTGESGTGKELVARAIHRQGPRRRGPFIDKNCAHEKSELLDSDLFGHEKGAFTGAFHQHRGRIERSNGGVLFLDEIGSMPQELQAKLLRVLETKRFQRLGGQDEVSSDFQLICATNDDPEKMVEEGRLREDLYYRIKQFDIHVPPLRERPGDVRILATLFLQRFKAGAGASYPASSFAESAMHLMESYHWPGNIRELKNVVERSAILARQSVINSEDLSSKVQNLTSPSIKSDVFTKISASKPAIENPTEWGLAYARLQLEFVACACEVGLKQNMKATEIVNNIWPRDPSSRKSGKGSTEKLKAFLRQIAKPPWGNPYIEQDETCKTFIDRIQSCLEQMGRKPVKC